MNTFKKIIGLYLLSILATSTLSTQSEPAQGYLARAKEKTKAGYEKAKSGVKTGARKLREHKGKVIGVSLAALLAYEMWYYYTYHDIGTFETLRARARNAGAAIYNQTMALFNNLRAGAKTYLPAWLGGEQLVPAEDTVQPAAEGTESRWIADARRGEEKQKAARKFTSILERAQKQAAEKEAKSVLSTAPAESALEKKRRELMEQVAAEQMKIDTMEEQLKAAEETGTRRGKEREIAVRKFTSILEKAQKQAAEKEVKSVSSAAPAESALEKRRRELMEQVAAEQMRIDVEEQRIIEEQKKIDAMEEQLKKEAELDIERREMYGPHEMGGTDTRRSSLARKEKIEWYEPGNQYGIVGYSEGVPAEEMKQKRLFPTELRFPTLSEIQEKIRARQKVVRARNERIKNVLFGTFPQKDQE